MTGAERRYLTTPIYYASGEPHIGHAYTTFLADTLARFHRQDGARVRFLTGTDEHGQKIQEEAERREMTPQELCDSMADRFREAWAGMDISYDRFIRTTEPEHRAVVQAFVQRLHDRGLIYADRYEGWYCVHEERYWTTKDLGPGETCPECGRQVRRIEEENYFFRMSRFQDDLVRHIEANPGWIFPESRKNEVLGFLRQPLSDLSISRPRSRIHWGVPLPFDGDHVIYVWVDALINYVTASGVLDPEGGPEQAGFEDPAGSWWPADLHIIGKDILTTHAVYWPTLLMGVGLPLPRRILSHGWWTVGEAKMSKSLGNVVDPLELRDSYGTDAVRWFLIREMPTGQDASYTPDRFLYRYEELANVVGNLASRTGAMITRYRGGTVPSSTGEGLRREIRDAVVEYRGLMEELRVNEALGRAVELARRANAYVEERRPWEAAKDPESAPDLDETLASLVHALAGVGALLFPVMPTRMTELVRRLGFQEIPTLDDLADLRVAERSVTKGEPLFPREERAGS